MKVTFYLPAYLLIFTCSMFSSEKETPGTIIPGLTDIIVEEEIKPQLASFSDKDLVRLAQTSKAWKELVAQELAIRRQRNMFLKNITEKVGFKKVLDMSRKGISIIYPRVFEAPEFADLASLNLSENSITFLNSNTFKGLKNLKILNLRETPLAVLDPKAFSDLPDLETLYLTGTKLTKLPMGIFDNLKSLRTLWLDDNYYLAELDPELFKGLNNLKEISLANGDYLLYGEPSQKLREALPNVEITPDQPKMVSERLEWEAREKQLQTNLHNLKSKLSSDKTTLLNLSDSDVKFITKFVKAFADDDFKNLESLNLSGFKIKGLLVLNKSIFEGLNKLKDLNLSKNKLEKITEAAFKGLKSLEIIDLSRNRIEELNIDAFKDLNKLETLDLSNNKLEECDPNIFKELKNLKVLDLSGNPLSPETINSLIDSLKKVLPNLEIITD